MKPQATCGALTDEERALLREHADREGISALADRLGVHREPLARALAGIGNRRGTIALIRAALVTRSAPPPAAA